MAAKLSSRLLWLLAVVYCAAAALRIDEVTTSDTILAAAGAKDGGEVAITIHLMPYGRLSSRELLFRTNNSADVGIALYYNKKSNMVFLEHLPSHLKEGTWSLGKHVRVPITLVVAPRRVSMLAGCETLHWHHLTEVHDVLPMLYNENLRLYRNKNIKIAVHTSEENAKESLNCNKHEANTETPSDVEDVQTYLEKRKKREGRQDDYNSNFLPSGSTEPVYSRGDIPSTAVETCDDEVIRQLTLLRRTIESLRQEVADQKGTIDHLRGQLRQCCSRVPAPERCSSASCYPG